MSTSGESFILVTGGAGFIGSTFVRQWMAEERSSVVNLDKLTYAACRTSLVELQDELRHEFVEGDITDAALIGELLERYRPTAIVHLAAETHVDRSIEQPPLFAVTNVLGTCTLLDVATRYWQGLEGAERSEFRFLLVSTDEVFGTARPGERFDEQSRLSPSSPYSASKAAGEHLVNAFATTYGLPILLANPSNNYGPRQLSEKLIPKMILAAAAGRPLPIYGDGLQERDWMHAEDCCRALRHVLRSGQPGERYLIGADHCRTNLDVVETICDLVDQLKNDRQNRRQLMEFVADRPGHDRRYAVDAALLCQKTDWRPQIDFATGLRETVQWYLQSMETAD